MDSSFVGGAIGTDFLPDAPLSALASGAPNRFDLMAGTCANDGGLFSLLLPFSKKLSAKLFSKNFAAYYPAGGVAELLRTFKKTYPDSPNIYERINNDLFYRDPTRRAVAAHAAGQTGTSYLYELDYNSALKGLGAIHGIEVALLFRAATAPALLHDDIETDQLADAMVEAWVNFAATGHPHAATLPDWPAYDAAGPCAMQLGRQSFCQSVPQVKL